MFFIFTSHFSILVKHVVRIEIQVSSFACILSDENMLQVSSLEQRFRLVHLHVIKQLKGAVSASFKTLQILLLQLNPQLVSTTKHQGTTVYMLNKIWQNYKISKCEQTQIMPPKIHSTTQRSFCGKWCCGSFTLVCHIWGRCMDDMLHFFFFFIFSFKEGLKSNT